MVKVCGLTREEDVVLAVELGAWAVGFVLAPSPRRVTPEQARDLAAAAWVANWRGASGIRPFTVGVFLDTPAEEIAETVVAAGLNGVQLHAPLPGALSVRMALSDRLQGDKAAELEVIQTVSVPAGGTDATRLREAALSARGAYALLFDTSVGGQVGGTGTPFDWGLVGQVVGDIKLYKQTLIAGGINPQNVAEALTVSGAFGVDVSSGVESSPGVKDPVALRALFEAVESVSEGRRP
jgi:phosphoribosylanthranilate isomerase